jgi:hypothetical protein
MAFMTPNTASRALAAMAVVLMVPVGCDKAKRLVGHRQATGNGAAATAASAEPLSESFAAKDGLMMLRYPADFAAQPSDDDVVALSRNLRGGQSDVLVFVAIANPISQEFSEFTRLSAQSELKRPADWEYRKVSEQKAICNGMPGLEIVATWKPAGASGRSRRWWCAFLRSGHGYVFSYNTPENVAETHGPLLRSIVDATTFPRQ